MNTDISIIFVGIDTFISRPYTYFLNNLKCFVNPTLSPALPIITCSYDVRYRQKDVTGKM
jgi:hypothetical protein